MRFKFLPVHMYEVKKIQIEIRKIERGMANKPFLSFLLVLYLGPAIIFIYTWYLIPGIISWHVTYLDGWRIAL